MLGLHSQNFGFHIFNKLTIYFFPQKEVILLKDDYDANDDDGNDEGKLWNVDIIKLPYLPYSCFVPINNGLNSK